MYWQGLLPSAKHYSPTEELVAGAAHFAGHSHQLLLSDRRLLRLGPVPEMGVWRQWDLPASPNRWPFRLPRSGATIPLEGESA